MVHFVSCYSPLPTPNKILNSLTLAALHPHPLTREPLPTVGSIHTQADHQERLINTPSYLSSHLSPHLHRPDIHQVSPGLHAEGAANADAESSASLYISAKQNLRDRIWVK